MRPSPRLTTELWHFWSRCRWGISELGGTVDVSKLSSHGDSCTTWRSYTSHTSRERSQLMCCTHMSHVCIGSSMTAYADNLIFESRELLHTGIGEQVTQLRAGPWLTATSASRLASSPTSARRITPPSLAERGRLKLRRAQARCRGPYVRPYCVGEASVNENGNGDPSAEIRSHDGWGFSGRARCRRKVRLHLSEPRRHSYRRRRRAARQTWRAARLRGAWFR